MLKTIAIATLLALTISAVPAVAQEEEAIYEMGAHEANFACEGPVTLRFADTDEGEAVVSVNGGADVVLPNTAFTGDEGLIHALDPNAKSCAGQKLCVAGFFQDHGAGFDVFVDGVRHHCHSSNWSGT
jgi:hypothetical protein